VHTQHAELITIIDGQALAHTLSIHLAPGRTLTVNSGRLINSSSHALQARATVRVPGLDDPRPGNNSHIEMIPKAP
jgi:hypothetical protein